MAENSTDTPTTPPTKDRQAEICIVQGPSGLCIYINDRRIAGPKPWGGGTTVRTWKVNADDIIQVLTT